jgi:O-glycosyl hydrolase
METGGAGRGGGEAGATGGRGGGGGLGANAGAGGAAGPRPTVTAAPGTTLVKVNTGVHHQTFEGWGTSLCWWANHVGGWDADAQDAVVDAVVDPVSGLGYNVFRYNIGGGENPAHDHMEQYRDMPGFQPSEGTWDWNADANQRSVLARIVQRGTGVIVEAFSNSPPYWMTKSGCAAGSSDGSNNLKDDSYDAFADYLTEVVKHFRDTWDISFRTLEPLNEPNASWWKENNGQEGCHFSPSNQQTLVKAVAESLAAKGLSATTLSASDENSIDDANTNLRTFDASALAAMSQMNVHSYAGSKREEVRALATSNSKRLWQSESGPLNQTLDDDLDAALFMAGRIILDLRDLEPEAWIDWQVGDPARSWASITLDDAQQKFAPLKRFYMHAGFSRYIRPGATFVDIDSSDMVAALSPDGHALTIVVRNGDTSGNKGFTFDLTSLPTLGATAEAHRTSRDEDLAALPSVALEAYSFVASVPASSITTFVVPMP